MSFIEQAMALATMPVPGPGTPEETRKTFDAMPMAELAPVWCALQRLSRRDLTDGTWMVSSYFDSLPHDGPERAFELVLEVLRSETDKSVRMQLNRRIMTVLVYPHGPRMIDRIEAEARGNPNLRWLLGGVHWWGPDEAVKARIKAVADIEGWDADKEAHERPERPIDCESMSLSELARAWIEHHSKAEKDQDGNWDTLCDYESDLVGENPDKTIDWILEILKIEDNPMDLGAGRRHAGERDRHAHHRPDRARGRGESALSPLARRRLVQHRAGAVEGAPRCDSAGEAVVGRSSRCWRLTKADVIADASAFALPAISIRPSIATARSAA
jgi:hypothetical protein